MSGIKNILVIIPARGGSKGIPRKNLKSLAGRPLIYYPIANAKKSRFKPDVYVSSDDEEILSISKSLGAKTLKRDTQDATDLVTLDPVIFKTLERVKAKENKDYDIVVTLQPTSPLLTTDSLDEAIGLMLENPDLDTVLSAVNDTHLTWKNENGFFKPNYKARVNRQELPPIYKETGGFLITKTRNVSLQNRLGKNISLFLLSESESVDIDNYSDWALCEYYLKRKKILFVVSGYPQIGLGHVYNTLSLASNFSGHEVNFLVDNKSKLAYQKISEKNYSVFIQSKKDILDDIALLSPDIVVNDCLDTSASYIASLKKQGYAVINFEDLGEGAKLADLTINAIYPEDEVLPNHFFGHKYFILRDEFLLNSPRSTSSSVREILISFGGVDPSNLTRKVLDSIYTECKKNKIKIKVITGFGYRKKESLNKFPDIKIYKNVTNISDHIRSADVVFTSAGRTTYEIASMSVPAIVLAQNSRELTHFFANAEYGFVNLGLGKNVSLEKISQSFDDLVKNYERRKCMADTMSKCDISSGRDRVIAIMNRVIN